MSLQAKTLTIITIATHKVNTAKNCCNRGPDIFFANCCPENMPINAPEAKGIAIDHNMFPDTVAIRTLPKDTIVKTPNDVATID